MGTDELNRKVLLNIVQMGRPADPWKQLQEPEGISFGGGYYEDEVDDGETQLKRDGIHTDWDIRSEKSGATLVAVKK